MTVTLPKGGNLFLTDEAPGIEQVRVGLGWTESPGSSAMELDGVISLVSNSAPGGRLLLAHQVPNPDESVSASRSNEPVVGDAEKIVVTLAAVPSDVTRLLFGAAIYDAAGRRQSFGSVRGAYVRVLNHANGIELARYTLERETGSETAMVFGELYRNPRGWKFRAVGQGYSTGLRGVAGNGSGEPPAVRPLDVTGYLRRVSPARSRRSFAEILDPPKPVTPKPAAVPPKPVPPKPVPPKPAPPAPAPTPSKPAPRPASSPSVSLSHRGRTSLAPPSRTPPPARPASPPPGKRPAARSSLDLSSPDEPASTAAPATPSPARIDFGEHSSRYRQRMEHVTALDDDHPVTTWTEQDRGSGGMTVTLRWEPLQTSSGLPRPSDVQLGCFWQAGDRAAGVMQTLGNAISAPGELGPRQVLRLGRRDEREGQTIFVDLAALPTFRRFFVFVYGLHGAPEWPLLRPTLTVAAPTGEQLTMRLGEAPPSARLCVVASFHVVQGDLVIRRENDYLDGVQADAAAKYGWTFEWNSDGMTVRAAP